MDYMYTKNDEKVLVLEKINNDQYLVKKVLIDIDGNEILSSEKYVETALNEKSNIRTWRTSELELLEKVEKEKIEKLKKSAKELELQYNILSNKLSYIKSVNHNFDSKNFDRLSDFLTGKIEYVIYDQYGCIIVKNFKEAEKTDYGLKLISLFGQDDGSLQYKIQENGDYRNVIPCKNIDELKENLTNIINKADYIYQETEEVIKKYNLKIDKLVIEKFYNKQIETFKKYLEENKNNIKLHNKKIKSMIAIKNQLLNN